MLKYNGKLAQYLRYKKESFFLRNIIAKIKVQAFGRKTRLSAMKTGLRP